MRKALLLGAPLLAGCLPVGLPPLELAGGGGLATIAKKPDEAMSKADASLRPLAMVGSLHDRPVDVGVGIHLEHSPSMTRYGPTLEARGFFLNGPIGERSRARLGFGAEGRVLIDDRQRWGPVGALHVAGEVSGFADGDCGSSASKDAILFGCYYGETAIGGIVEGSYGRFDGLPAWTFTASLTLRTPALVGVLFFIPKK